MRKKHPEATLLVIGQPTKATAWMDPLDGIDFVGFHRDFRSYFAKAHMSIVPLLSGSGTRFKILDSWAMGKPIVSTRIGAEGLAFEDGENLLIADQPKDFVEQIDRMYKDKELRRHLAKKGRRLAEDQYSWKAIVDHLEAKLNGALEKKRHASRL